MRRSLGPSELGFNAYDRQRLAKALATAVEARVFRRLQAVLLVAEGRSFAETAQITRLGLRTVYHLVERNLPSQQVASLEDQTRPGRPVAAPELTAGQILRELRRSPLKLGYRTNVWTVATLAHHLNQRYHCGIAPWTLRRRLKQLDLVCKRPRYFYSEKASHRAQKKGRSSAN